VVITNGASRLRVNNNPDVVIELPANWSATEAQTVIRAIYRQVLGNEYLMANERLTRLESLLSNGQLNVREFVRGLAKSELYKNKFLYPVFQTKAIELNFKHLLGRAPCDETELIEHLNRYQNHGYDADIDSYLDSGEYDQNFGDLIVPYYRGFSMQGGQKIASQVQAFNFYCCNNANSDNSQLQGTKSRLVAKISSISAAENKSQRIFDNANSSEHFYKIEVSGIDLSHFPQFRHRNQEFIVLCAQLHSTLAYINKIGGKVASVTLA
jgi:phycocyanin-associated rod linker protein